MPATVANDLRLELEQIIDSKLRSLLTELEGRLADGVARGDISLDQKPAKRGNSRQDGGFSSSSKKSLTSKGGYEAMALPDTERQDPEREDSRGTLSARRREGGSREIAYSQVPAVPLEDELDCEDVEDEKNAMFKWCVNVITLLMLFTAAGGDIIEVDIFARTGTDTFPEWYKRMSTVLWVGFMMELGIRIYMDGKKFFWCKHRWNYFQLLLVSSNSFQRICVMQGWTHRLGIPVHDVRMGFRFISTIRILRVLKILDQLDATAELHMLLTSLHGSLSSLGWAAVFILIPTYVFGLGLTELVADFRMEKGTDEFSEQYEDLMHFFGTLDRSMISLFWCIAGGLSWSEAMLPLKHFDYGWTSILLVLYISAMVFAVLNVLTGVFVTSATTAATMERDRKVMATLQKIFIDVDQDRSGNLSRDEFHALLKHKDIGLCLQALSFRPEQANHLFDLIDDDNSGVVNIDEFMKGCERLQGGLTAIDFASYMSDFQALRADVRSVMDQLAWNNSLARQLSGGLIIDPAQTSMGVMQSCTDVMQSFKSKLR